MRHTSSVGSERKERTHMPMSRLRNLQEQAPTMRASARQTRRKQVATLYNRIGEGLRGRASRNAQDRFAIEGQRPSPSIYGIGPCRSVASTARSSLPHAVASSDGAEVGGRILPGMLVRVRNYGDEGWMRGHVSSVDPLLVTISGLDISEGFDEVELIS